MVGPHVRLEVPGARDGNGLAQLGIGLSVVVVDLGVESLNSITVTVPRSRIRRSRYDWFDLDIIPGPQSFAIVEVGTRMDRYSSWSKGTLRRKEQQRRRMSHWQYHCPKRSFGRRHHSRSFPSQGKTKGASKEEGDHCSTLRAAHEPDGAHPMANQIAELQKGQVELHESMEQQRLSPPPRASQMPVSKAVDGVAGFAK